MGERNDDRHERAQRGIQIYNGVNRVFPILRFNYVTCTPVPGLCRFHDDVLCFPHIASCHSLSATLSILLYLLVNYFQFRCRIWLNVFSRNFDSSLCMIRTSPINVLITTEVKKSLLQGDRMILVESYKSSDLYRFSCKQCSSHAINPAG